MSFVGTGAKSTCPNPKYLPCRLPFGRLSKNPVGWINGNLLFHQDLLWTSSKNRVQFATSDWRGSFQMRYLETGLSLQAEWAGHLGSLTLDFMFQWRSNSCSLEKQVLALYSTHAALLAISKAACGSCVCACGHMRVPRGTAKRLWGPCGQEWERFSVSVGVYEGKLHHVWTLTCVSGEAILSRMVSHPTLEIASGPPSETWHLKGLPGRAP